MLAAWSDSRRLAWASIVVGVIAWVPLALVLGGDADTPAPSGEIQGMAAVGAAFEGVVVVVCGALVGTVLALLALRRPTRHRAAWAGLGINVIPLSVIIGFAAMHILSR